MGLGGEEAGSGEVRLEGSSACLWEMADLHTAILNAPPGLAPASQMPTLPSRCSPHVPTSEKLFPAPLFPDGVRRSPSVVCALCVSSQGCGLNLSHHGTPGAPLREGIQKYWLTFIIVLQWLLDTVYYRRDGCSMNGWITRGSRAAHDHGTGTQPYTTLFSTGFRSEAATSLERPAQLNIWELLI